MKLFELKRFFVVMLLVCLGVTQGWATHDTHYGKVTVTADGNGSVYIGTSDNAITENTTETWNCEKDGDKDTKTFFLFAKPADGYAFTGWSGDGTTSTDNPYKISVTAESTKNGSPTTKNYTATFKEKHTFSAKVTVEAWCDNVQNSDFGTVTVEGQQESSKEEEYGGEVADVNFNVKAENTNDHYEFYGWSENGTDILSHDAKWTYPVQCTVNVHVDKTLRAIYRQKKNFKAKVKLHTIYINNNNVNSLSDGGGAVTINGESRVNNEFEYSEYTTQDTQFDFTIAADKEDPDYEFFGWTTERKITTQTNWGSTTYPNVTTTNPRNVSIQCKYDDPEKTDEYYAVFKKHYHSNVILHSPSEQVGKVNVSASNTAGSYKVESTLAQNTVTTSHTYYPKAQAVTGYTFEGWYANPEFTGDKLTFTNNRFTVDATTGTSKVPVKEEYYAKFVKNTDNAEYLRNRETGRFLMNGGTNSTHAVVGNYAKMPVGRVAADNGEIIYTPYGHLSADAIVDGAATAWVIEEIEGEEGFYTISCDGMALTTKDGKYFNDNPLYHYVGTANLNAKDKHQQWEIVTKAMLDAEIAKATPDNPVNVSHFIKNPNFDKVDGPDGWVFDSSGLGNISVSQDHGIGGRDDDNCNYNRWISKGNIFGANASWKLNQNLEGLRTGYYVVTCQGFVNSEHYNSFFIGNNDSGSWVGQGVNLKKHDSEKPSADNSYESAMDAFNKGLYQNIIETPVHVTKGKLEIGVETKDDGKDGNTFLDNFQLYYLGEINPNRKYTDYDVIGSARQASINNETNTVTLAGTWREVDMKNITDTNVPETGDLSQEITNSTLVIDATNATLIAKPTFPTPANPNSIIKVMGENKVANTQNVVYGVEENGDVMWKSTNLVLHDNHVLAPIKDVTAKNVTVERTLKGSGTNGDGTWNTLCLPFDWNKKMLDGAVVKKLSGIDYPKPGSYNLHFSEVDENETLSAGTPYMVKVDGDEITEFSPKGEIVVNTTESALVKDNTVGNKTEGEVTFKGSFDPCTIPYGSYIISNNTFYFVDVYDLSSKGFRGWFEVANGEITGRVNALSASFDDDATGITSVNDDAPTELSTGWYNIAGQRVNENAKGIIIKNGKKYLVK